MARRKKITLLGLLGAEVAKNMASRRATMMADAFITGHQHMRSKAVADTGAFKTYTVSPLELATYLRKAGFPVTEPECAWIITEYNRRGTLLV